MSLYIVETKDCIFWSDRKMDAAYKHCEFLYGQATFRTLSKEAMLARAKKFNKKVQEIIPETQE